MSKIFKKLVGGAKPARLNPWKRIKTGKEVVVTVDGVENTAINDNAEKYGYINVEGVDYYVTGALIEGTAYTVVTVDVEAEKAEKAARAEATKAERAAAREAKKAEEAAKAAEGGEAAAPARTRGRKADSAGEGAAAQASA